MTTIKVKLRHSGVQGKAGTIYYQITHRRRTRRIATCLQIAPENWQSAAQCIAPAISQTPEGRLLRHCIERDVASLHRIVRELDSQGSSYEPDDIIMRFRIMEQQPSGNGPKLPAGIEQFYELSRREKRSFFGRNGIPDRRIQWLSASAGRRSQHHIVLHAYSQSRLQ